jgi:integrase
MAGVDTKTRYQGVFARHQLHCALGIGNKRCNCTPSYFGTAWDQVAGRTRKTKYFNLVGEARDARRDLQAALAKDGGGALAPRENINLEAAISRFLKAAEQGVARNKWRRSYRPRACEDLKVSLKHVPPEMRRRRPERVTRGEVQALIDKLDEAGLSASRISSVVNSLRALYRWLQDRELATHDPAQHVRLPLSDATPRDRVATPAEFIVLLDALTRPTPEEIELKKLPEARNVQRDSIPFALAAYATARSQEIKYLDWRDVDWSLNAVELAANKEGRKPGGSWRVVPLVKPLRGILRREWLAQGRPKQGKVCPPRRKSQSGLLALNLVQARTHKRWRALKLEPIGLHESRHTAATWLDHAGISPRIASEIMGHKTPEYQPGAARITLERYTHKLPGELERARVQLDKFLAERAEDTLKVRGL